MTLTADFTFSLIFLLREQYSFPRQAPRKKQVAAPAPANAPDCDYPSTRDRPEAADNKGEATNDQIPKLLPMILPED